MAFEMKKGQSAVWIILAVFLLAAILLYLFLQDPAVDVVPVLGGDPGIKSYLESCTTLFVLEATDIMLPQGGFIEPRNFVYFNRTKVEYVCETMSYFEPCIQQHPMLIREMEREIKNYILSNVSECFVEMKDTFEDMGWTVSFSSALDIEVDLKPDKAIVYLNKEMTVRKADSTKSFESFEIPVRSAAYNLGVIAQEIATQEANFCYFESAGFSLAYPQYNVRRKMMSYQQKVYLLRDKRLEDDMMVAVRSCALPEGMPG